jgi:hypothetical protein
MLWLMARLSNVAAEYRGAPNRATVGFLNEHNQACSTSQGDQTFEARATVHRPNLFHFSDDGDVAKALAFVFAACDVLRTRICRIRGVNQPSPRWQRWDFDFRGSLVMRESDGYSPFAQRGPDGRLGGSPVASHKLDPSVDNHLRRIRALSAQALRICRLSCAEAR